VVLKNLIFNDKIKFKLVSWLTLSKICASIVFDLDLGTDKHTFLPTLGLHKVHFQKS